MTAWYDASVASNVSMFGSSVASFNDESGNGNNLAQAVSALEPTYNASGINGLGSVAFNGKQYLLTASSAISGGLFNESTTFVVASPTGTGSMKPLFSGPYNANPRYEMLFNSNATTYFNFGNNGTGSVAAGVVANVPGLWTLAGSVSKSTEVLRKNGNTLKTRYGSRRDGIGQLRFIARCDGARFELR